MKKLLFLIIVTTHVQAQVDTLEALQRELVKASTEEARIDLLNKLSHFYSQYSLESSEGFAHQALQQAEKIDYKRGIASANNNLGICHAVRGDYTSSLEYFITALRIREQINDLKLVSHTLNNISRVFIYQKEFDKALEYARKSMDILQQNDDPKALGSAYISFQRHHSYYTQHHSYILQLVSY